MAGSLISTDALDDAKSRDAQAATDSILSDFTANMQRILTPPPPPAPEQPAVANPSTAAPSSGFDIKSVVPDIHGLLKGTGLESFLSPPPQPQQQQGSGSEPAATSAPAQTQTSPPQAQGVPSGAALAQPAGMPSSTSGTGYSGPPDSAIPSSLTGTNRQERITSAVPIAQAVEAKTGMPADVNLAFAVHESGLEDRYGPGMNYHGRQALQGEAGTPYKDWSPGPNGEQQFYDSRLKSYDNPSGSFQDFADLVTTAPRYAPAWQRYQQTHDKDQLIRDIWAAGYGESPTGPGETVDIRQNQTAGPSTSRTAATPPAAQVEPARQQAQQPSGNGYRPSQFDSELTREEAIAACGIAGAVGFAAATGHYPTVKQAEQIAQNQNLWSPQTGMYGPSAEVALLKQMGVAARMTPGVNWGQVRQQVASGNPVMFDTDAGSAGHYYFIEGARQRSDGQWEYDLGTSATDLRASGGKRWYTEAEIPGLGFGNPANAIYLDDPSTMRASPVAGKSRTDAGESPTAQTIAQVASSSTISTDAAGVSSAISQAPSVDTTPSSTAQPTMYRQPLSAPTMGADSQTGSPEDVSSSPDASAPSPQPPPWEQQSPSPAVPVAAAPGAMQDDYTDSGRNSPWTSSSGSVASQSQSGLQNQEPIAGSVTRGMGTTNGATSASPPTSATAAPSLLSASMVDATGAPNWQDDATQNGYNPSPSNTLYPVDTSGPTQGPIYQNNNNSSNVSPDSSNPDTYGVGTAQPTPSPWDAAQMALQSRSANDTTTLTGLTNAISSARQNLSNAITSPADQASPGRNRAGSSPLKPLYDLAGTVIGYVRDEAQQAGNAIMNSPLPGIAASVATGGAAAPLYPNAEDAASSAANTVSQEGIATPVARAISNPIRQAMDKAPLPDTGQPETPIDRALVETGQSISHDIQNLQGGTAGDVAWGVAGLVGDLAPSTTLARQLNYMLPRADVPGIGEVGAGDVVMTLALAHDAARLGYGAIQAGGRVWSAIADAVKAGVPAERFSEWASQTLGGPLNSAANTIDRGIGAVRSNADEVARLDAERAGQRSAVAPGIFGVAPPEAGQAAQDVLRPHVVPPEVAVGLGVERNIPDDPRLAQAVEASGGKITDRGIEVNLTRAQDPGAAGGTATRGGVFYEARPEGEVSSYYKPSEAGPQGTGGNQGIPATPTVIRSPLVIEDEVGTPKGFNGAMQQLGVTRLVTDTDLQNARTDIRLARKMIADAPYTKNPEAAQRAGEEWLQTAQNRLAQYERDGRIQVTDEGVNEAIKDARNAGPPGSPERAQAIKDLVAKYGGDPSVIDDLLNLRGADASESAYAIRENIVAQNARAAGHDAVMALQEGQANANEVNQHALVVAAQKKLKEVGDLWRAAQDQLRERERVVDPRGMQPQLLKGDSEWNALKSRVRNLEGVYEDAQQGVYKAQQEAERLLVKPRIREVMDVRESRNPTPGAENPRIAEIEQQIQDLHDRGVTASSVFDPLYEELDAARTADRVGTPGYALRPEYAPRAEAQGLPASTIAENPARVQAEEAYQRLTDQVEAMRQALGPYPKTNQLNALMDLEESLKDARLRWYDAQGAPRYVTDPEAAARARRGGGTAPGATLGTLPSSAISDRLAGVNRVLGQGVASTFSGGTAAAAAGMTDPGSPQGENESDAEYAARRARERAQRMGTAFAVGAVAPLAISRGARALARATGAEARGAEGALATLGPVPPAANNLPPKVQQNLQAAVPRAQQQAQRRGVSAMDWLRTLGNSGIFGPASATVNVGGAVTNLALSVPKEFIRAAVRGQPAEYAPMALATFRALPEMFSGVVKAALASDPASISARAQNPVAKGLGYAAERPASVLMGAPDAFFRPMFDLQGMYREAAQVATGMKLKGSAWWQAVEDGVQMAKMARNGQAPPNPQVAGQIASAGKAYADRMLFQGELNPGSVGKAVNDLANRDGLAGVIGNLVLPFTKTPYHMAMRTMENVPGSAAFPSLRGQQPTRFDAAYDQMFGAVLAGGLLYAAQNGRITGPGPSDPEKRRQMMNQGWQPNSIVVGGHFDPNDASQGTVAQGAVYIPTRMVGQFQPILDAAGGTHDALTYEKDDQKAGKLLTNTLGSRGVVTNMVYLSGLANIISMMDSSDPTSGLPRFLAQTAARYVPGAGIARSAATAEDPLQRRTSRQSDVGFPEAVRQEGAMSVPGALENVSPIGSREGLRPTLDVLGRPQANPQQGIAALGPKMTTGQQDPIIDAYERAGIDLTQPRQDVTIAGVKVPLTPEEQDQYNTLRGDQLIRMMQSRAGRGDFTQMNPATRRQILQTYLDTANETATARVTSGMKDRARRIHDAMEAQRLKQAS